MLPQDTGNPGPPPMPEPATSASEDLATCSRQTPPPAGSQEGPVAADPGATRYRMPPLADAEATCSGERPADPAATNYPAQQQPTDPAATRSSAEPADPPAATCWPPRATCWPPRAPSWLAPSRGH
jgi:hypothetical protein